MMCAEPAACKEYSIEHTSTRHIQVMLKQIPIYILSGMLLGSDMELIAFPSATC